MLVESVRQCLARRQVLLRKQPEAQNHRLEGLQRSSRLTRSNGTPRLLDQEKFLAGLDRTDGPRKLPSSAPSLCEENGWTARAERYRVRENEAAMRRSARCAPDELPATGIGDERADDA